MDGTIGFIKIFAGKYAPINWDFCNGQLLSTTQYEELFSIIGTTFGGDGHGTFALPNLCGRMPVRIGKNAIIGGHSIILGERSGTETETILEKQLPVHRHTYNALSGNSESDKPTNNFLSPKANNFYAKKDATDQLLPMNAEVMTPAKGDGLSHNNMSPFIVINYIICVEGLYPARP
jgi:microcystin-dependent protein